jgi:hypothetical protein
VTPEDVKNRESEYNSLIILSKLRPTSQSEPWHCWKCRPHLHTSNPRTFRVNPSALLIGEGKFSELEKHALLLSVQKQAPFKGKNGAECWKVVSKYMLSEFCIVRPANSCKMSWLRRISYEYRYDERIGQFIPDDAPKDEREKLKRSQYSTPKLDGKKRKVTESDETTSKKKRNIKASPPLLDDNEEVEMVEELDESEEEKEVEKVTENLVVDEVDDAGKDSEKNAEKEAQIQANVFFCSLCDTVVEQVNEDPAPTPMSDAILRAQLLEMLMKAREWESYDQTRRRELRWHREMTWVKFQIPGHEKWAPVD